MPAYDSITIPYLFVILVWMPASAIRSYWRLKSGKPLGPKPRRYRAMIASQIFVLAYSLLAARENRISLLGHAPAAWIWVVTTFYLGLLAFVLRNVWRRLSQERKQRARRLLPENSREMRYWIPISLLAGLSEEYAFRGVAYVALRELTGSPPISVAICVLAFAVAHIAQGWRGVLGTGIIAMAMHVIVFLTAGLYLPIAAHAAYDLVVGVIAMQNFVRDDAVSAMNPQPVT
ncbi:MAG TPA: type II CAAX endopeptidase family protein [Terriglobales bacterium]|nr:type II CAAX endopeptidase family protein [Terriglobales bacterium]